MIKKLVFCVNIKSFHQYIQDAGKHKLHVLNHNIMPWQPNTFCNSMYYIDIECTLK